MKKILKEKLSELIDLKLDEDYKNTIPVQAKNMKIPEQTFRKYINGISDCSISNLTKIAKYYNVSTDYLLGLAQEPTADKDLNAVCEYTGLTNNAILTLVELKGKSYSRAYTDLLSCIIADANFEYLLGLFEGYIVPNKESISASFSMSRADINYKDLCMFAANNAMRNILDDVSEEFTQKYKTTDERLDILFEKKKKEKGWE